MKKIGKEYVFSIESGEEIILDRFFQAYVTRKEAMNALGIYPPKDRTTAYTSAKRKLYSKKMLNIAQINIIYKKLGGTEITLGDLVCDLKPSDLRECSSCFSELQGNPEDVRRSAEP